MLTEVKSTDQPLSPGAWGEWTTTRDQGSQVLSEGTTIAVLQQHLWLVLGDNVYQCFTWVNPSTRSWFPTTLMLAVAVTAHALAAILADEPTLTRELTAPVGYCWQNSRCCRLILKPQPSCIGDLVSYPNDTAQQQGPQEGP